jgi:uncharacterized protein (UPF0261 family)
MLKRRAILLGACLDTKGEEAQYLCEVLKDLGNEVLVIDGGIKGVPLFEPKITREEVARASGFSLQEIQRIPHEGEAIMLMAQGAQRIAEELIKEKKIQGMIGFGGSMGTLLWGTVMQGLPLGFPKVLISTQASNPQVIKRVVRGKDICLFNSPVDLAGLNPLTKSVFLRAAWAISGMVKCELEPIREKTVALCAKGNVEGLTALVRKKLLEKGFTPITFHGWGYGPLSLEEAIKEELITAGVIELSNDYLEYLYGGTSYPPEDRYENAIKKGLPLIYVPGSCDIIATFPEDEKFKGRKYVKHNPSVWSYRTTKEELYNFAIKIGEKLKNGKEKVTVIIPTKGFSIYDGEGRILNDEEARSGFVEGIKKFDKIITIKVLPYHILDAKFADEVVNEFIRIYENINKGGG